MQNRSLEQDSDNLPRQRLKPSTRGAKKPSDDEDSKENHEDRLPLLRFWMAMTSPALAMLRVRRGLSPLLCRPRAASLVALMMSLIFLHNLLLFPSYQSNAERDARHTRFPSVEERVKLYTSSWYLPPCNSDTRISYEWLSDENLRVKELASSAQQGQETRFFDLQSDAKIDQLFYYQNRDLKACAHRPLFDIQTYCIDALSTLVGSLKKSGFKENGKNPPVLLKFGDAPPPAVRFPYIMKFRLAMNSEQLKNITSGECNSIPLTDMPSPMLWKLETNRHFRGLSLIPRLDQSWNAKIDKAIFRGALTGEDPDTHELGGDITIKKHYESSNSNNDDENDEILQKCLRLPRCKLVYQYANSSLIDAKLTRLMDRVPEKINGVTVAEPIRKFRGLMPVSSLMRYKGIIILEGNDVSSGLKWVLLSQSVVLMPPPTKTSWAMEELLEPWVHYIPLQTDLSDVQKKVQWMVDHQDEAQKISNRASLWMKDLVFHPDAARDDSLIYREILRRYKAYF